MKIIFHIPYNLDVPIYSGSYNRPRMMRQAFLNEGIDIVEISGTYKERKDKIKEAKKQILAKQIDFVYAESATIPTILSNKYHIPLNADFKFLKYCKLHGLKIGLFYRDIHWRFIKYSGFKSQFISKYYKPFYQNELKVYAGIVTKLFLPSLEMKNYLPHLALLDSKELPSGGGFNSEVKTNITRHTGRLKFIYIGGVGKQNSLYDITTLFKALKDLFVKLTVICREKEWNEVKSNYSSLLNDNINIAHQSSEEAVLNLKNSNIGLLVYPKHIYRNFAFPYKVFEYLFNGLPIIANDNTPVADFIRENNVGWIIPNEEKAISDLIKILNANKDEVYKMRDNIQKIIPNHTWEARVKTIVSELT